MSRLRYLLLMISANGPSQKECCAKTAFKVKVASHRDSFDRQARPCLSERSLYVEIDQLRIHYSCRAGWLGPLRVNFELRI